MPVVLDGKENGQEDEQGLSQAEDDKAAGEDESLLVQFHISRTSL